jgi:hypothetical protein
VRTKIASLELLATEEAELFSIGTRFLGLQEGRDLDLGLGTHILGFWVRGRPVLDGAAVERSVLDEEVLELRDFELEPSDPVGLSAVFPEVGGFSPGARQRQAGIEARQGIGREAELVRRSQAGSRLILTALRSARLQAAGAGELAVARQLPAAALET